MAITDKINGYLNERTSGTILGTEYLDLDATDDLGVTYESNKLTIDNLVDYINDNVDNIYSVDGALTGHRTIDMAGFRAIWEDGNIILKSELSDIGYTLWNTLTQERGSFKHNVSLDSGELSLINSSGQYFYASDGKVGINTTSLSASLNITGDGSDVLFVENSSNLETLRVMEDRRVRLSQKVETSIQASLGVIGRVGHDLTNYSILFNSGSANTILNAPAGDTVDIRNNNSVKYNFGDDGMMKGNSHVGMKIGAYLDEYGLGMQNGNLQFLMPNLAIKYSWNIGTSVSNTEVMTLLINGNLGIGTASPTALLNLGASVSSKSSLKIDSGVAPTSPNNGDIWFDGTNIKMRIGGVTKTFTLT